MIRVITYVADELLVEGTQESHSCNGWGGRLHEKWGLVGILVVECLKGRLVNFYASCLGTTSRVRVPYLEIENLKVLRS